METFHGARRVTLPCADEMDRAARNELRQAKAFALKSPSLENICISKSKWNCLISERPLTVHSQEALILLSPNQHLLMPSLAGESRKRGRHAMGRVSLQVCAERTCESSREVM